MTERVPHQAQPAAQPTQRARQCDLIRAHLVRRTDQTARLLGSGNDRFQLVKRPRQPRCQAIGQ